MSVESRIFSISEVEELTGVAPTTLRQWEEKFPNLNPTRRRGRRYYTAQDLDLIKLLKHKLVNEGYTVKAVQELLAKGGADRSQPDRLAALHEIRTKLASALESLRV